ncbi:MAG: PhzF family phenazine biosynthesis protein [Ignavibacteriae bacterium]|nr:MAG: PhzF family phenazine biosynthesis protein [Ignavibacteriota bacterium]
MRQFKFKKIDAFATAKSNGNPAGYIILNSMKDVTPEQMLQIAKELKGFVNEVGYLCKTSDHQFDLKYYSAEREVDFCGHATVAIMYDVLKSDEDLQRFNSLQIKTNRGILNVENRIRKEDAVFILSPEPFEKTKLPDINELAANLKTHVDSINTNFPISIINAGLSTLIVPIKSLESILALSPELEMLKEFCLKSEVDIIEVFTSDVADKSNNYRTRVFAPTFGYIEDPATGSGNSAFGYYLIKNKLWNGDTISIEQNGHADCFNNVKLRRQTDDRGNERVVFGGGARIRIEGTYFLQ